MSIYSILGILNVEEIIVAASGALIIGLFGIIWYFVTKYMARLENRDKEISNTLANLNTTMAKINTNLEIYQAKTSTELQLMQISVQNIVLASEVLSKRLENHEIRLNKLEDHENRNCEEVNFFIEKVSDHEKRIAQLEK